MLLLLTLHVTCVYTGKVYTVPLVYVTCYSHEHTMTYIVYLTKRDQVCTRLYDI